MFPQYLRPFLALALWMSCSISLIFLNSFILTTFQFHFPIYLTFVQSLGISLFLFVYYKLSSRENPYNSVNRGMYQLYLVPISAMFSLSIVLRNFVYLFMSVAVMQMLAAASPVIIFTTGVALGVEQFAFKLVLAICGVCAGLIIAVSGPIVVTANGVCLQLAATVLEGIRCFRLKEFFRHNVRYDSLDVLFLVMPVTASFLYIPASLIDLVHVYDYTMSEGFAVHVLIFVNILCAGALNFSSLFLLKEVSVLSASLAGVFKDCIIVAISLMRGDDEFTSFTLIGWGVSTASMYCYIFLRNSHPQLPYPEK
jgi:hypothetical protein